MQTTTMAEKPPARTAICFEETDMTWNSIVEGQTPSASRNETKPATLLLQSAEQHLKLVHLHVQTPTFQQSQLFQNIMLQGEKKQL